MGKAPLRKRVALRVPSAEQIAHAKRLVAAFNAHQEARTGAFEFEGKMVDMPIVRAAENVLARARGRD